MRVLEVLALAGEIHHFNYVLYYLLTEDYVCLYGSILNAYRKTTIDTNGQSFQFSLLNQQRIFISKFRNCFVVELFKFHIKLYEK